MSMLTSLICFSLAIMAYAIMSLQGHGKLRFGKNPQGFWGEDSWYNKYKTDHTNRTYGMTPARDTWYTRTFKIKYKERFPLSATALVWTTDGWHFMQLLFIKLFVASIIFYVPMFSWWADGGIYLASWYLVFNVTYKVLSK